MITLKRGVDQVVTLPKLRTNTTIPTYLNAAEVKATLYDPKGVVVPQFRNVSLLYVDDSDGSYEWPIDGPLLMIPTSTLYKLEVTAKEGSYNFRTVEPVTITD